MTSAEEPGVCEVLTWAATTPPTPRTPPATDPRGSGRSRRLSDTPAGRGSPVGSSSEDNAGVLDCREYLFFHIHPSLLKYINTINFTFLVLNKGKLDLIMVCLTFLATYQKFLLKKISTVVYHWVKELKKSPNGGNGLFFRIFYFCKQR